MRYPTHNMNVRRKILEYIVDHQERWHCVPTQAEIRALFSGMSEDVDLHLRQLEREGWVVLGREDDGSIALLPTYTSIPKIPFRGCFLDRSHPPVTGHHVGSIALDLRGIGFSMPKASLEAFHVLDESMIDAGIVHGDIALIEAAVPTRGDIVLVTLDGRDVLRRFLTIQGIPHFLAENPQHPDLRSAFEVPISGVFWGLIRTEPSRRHFQEVPRKVSYSADATTPAANLAERQEPQRSPILAGRISSRTKRGAKAKGETETKRLRSVTLPVLLPKDWPDPPSGNRLNDFPDVEVYKGGVQLGATEA